MNCLIILCHPVESVAAVCFGSVALKCTNNLRRDSEVRHFGVLLGFGES